MKQKHLATIILFLVCSIANANSNIPILEEVQPDSLKSGELYLELPIERFVAFKGDIVTVPIKLAVGKGDSQSVKLRVKPVLKSNQQGSILFAPLGHHWINGYTSFTGERGDDMSTLSSVSRTNHGLPLTKFLRFGISTDLKSGEYAVKIIGEGNNNTVTKYFRVAVHDELLITPPDIKLEENSLTLKIRDISGYPITAEAVVVSVLTESAFQKFSIDELTPGSGEYQLNVPNSDAIKQIDYKLIFNDRPNYEGTVSF